MNEMMNCLRRMDSSESRNSTTAEHKDGALPLALDWLGAAAIVFTVMGATAGIDFRLGGVAIRSHSAERGLIAVGIVWGIRLLFGITSRPAWLTRMALLTAITGSIATWFRFLLATIGGADSYGYVSASRLIASGHLVAPAPIAQWLSAANRLAIASPLGWAPAPDASGIVPTYPIGVSTLMAVFSMIGGSSAVFLVSPIAAAITLFLVYRLTREWFDAETALFAAAIVAWNPLFITYAKQPMSDMAATMWVVLALVLAIRSPSASAFAAGLAAGASVITRPALLVAAAFIPFAAYRGDDKRMRFALGAAGLAIGVIVQMVIQDRLFGSPMSSGYGTAGEVLSTAHVKTNAGIFLRHGWDVAGVLWLPGLIIGWFASRPEPRGKPTILLGAVTLPYLFWLPFDHWETLRFLLPGLVPLTVLVATGLTHIARVPRNRAVTAAMIGIFMTIIVAQSEHLLRQSSVWDIASIEARYPLAGEWINVNTPPNSVVMANQHSGSLRWYGKRETIRWDFVDPSALATTVGELQSHGATVYVALEGDEVAMFDQRFSAVVDQLQVDHVGSIRNVSFLRLLSK
jgi:hypothetical protein